jgi:hypothetical protein
MLINSQFIASRTFASGPLPSATPRIAMSRSVIMPTSFSFSVTGSRLSIDFLHQCRCTANRVVWFDKLHVSAHDVADIHCLSSSIKLDRPPSLTLSRGIPFMTLQVEGICSCLVFHGPCLSVSKHTESGQRGRARRRPAARLPAFAAELVSSRDEFRFSDRM